MDPDPGWRFGATPSRRLNLLCHPAPARRLLIA